MTSLSTFPTKKPTGPSPRIWRHTATSDFGSKGSLHRPGCTRWMGTGAARRRPDSLPTEADRSVVVTPSPFRTRKHSAPALFVAYLLGAGKNAGLVRPERGLPSFPRLPEHFFQKRVADLEAGVQEGVYHRLHLRNLPLLLRQKQKAERTRHRTSKSPSTASPRQVIDDDRPSGVAHGPRQHSGLSLSEIPGGNLRNHGDRRLPVL